ncbi:MAG: indolepyruvate oxidoreductase [Deltaproteobacteria bacterium]|nr:indolepyruvate oxidoreductase [Deltaproteobacteria bacterium]MBW1746850.1 indolepyruvate oxidoreductase [Deltaproteobacteria bacterium]MBW1825444.1 indolepyruvate oxidoreductase [Deltaproteobacteria bacterium]MBW1968016.1 indolepyruvate oxidoreductase [Deltaproteobacteria bacterium]MBW2155164.1 indolepyruvate oxidoreductase [Deltaproteobacteria bacterium]
MIKRKLMLGNEAIALGLMENGCTMATSYPGTPASEILASFAALQKEESMPRHVQWAVNEKVAFEIAYAGSMSGLRTAVSMKQVGLNVASDSLMSAAYLGVTGGFVVISADDPGPHSSQTEQDSRLMAMMAKIPVLDPDSPMQAREMVATAFELSETFEIPVMLRPTTRVCHARQDVQPGNIQWHPREIDFQKDPTRWAATPKFRFHLHQALEKKLDAIASYPKTAPVRLNVGADASKAVIVSGVAAGHAKEIMKDLNLWDRIPMYQVLQPFPLHGDFVSHMIDTYDEILVVEETTGIIEMQLADRHRIKGKLTRSVPRVGELLPETVEKIISEFAGVDPVEIDGASDPGVRPTLCAGCPHRAAFFAIKKAAPKGIYPSDIGCYTLGLNLGAVDTVLCMGAAVSQAAGFYHAFKNEKKPPDIVATIGDSTFFHAGVPALIDAVVQKVSFVLVILDNRTTAMTGNQPTPAVGIGAVGESLNSVEIEALVEGCGVKFCRVEDPYNLNEFISLLKDAVKYSREHGPAVVISRHPCLIDRLRKEKPAHQPVKVEVSDECDGCGFCVDHFECPALVLNEAAAQVDIDPILCNGCGVCICVCPKNSIKEKGKDHSESTK